MSSTVLAILAAAVVLVAAARTWLALREVTREPIADDPHVLRVDLDDR